MTMLEAHEAISFSDVSMIETALLTYHDALKTQAHDEMKRADARQDLADRLEAGASRAMKLCNLLREIQRHGRLEYVPDED